MQYTQYPAHVAITTTKPSEAWLRSVCALFFFCVLGNSKSKFIHDTSLAGNTPRVGLIQGTLHKASNFAAQAGAGLMHFGIAVPHRIAKPVSRSKNLNDLEFLQAEFMWVSAEVCVCTLKIEPDIRSMPISLVATIPWWHQVGTLEQPHTTWCKRWNLLLRHTLLLAR